MVIFFKLTFNVIDISATLTKDNETNTRRFTVIAKRKGTEDYTVYVWTDAVVYIAVTVDWTQSGMREICHKTALNRIKYFKY